MAPSLSCPDTSVRQWMLFVVSVQHQHAVPQLEMGGLIPILINDKIATRDLPLAADSMWARLYRRMVHLNYCANAKCTVPTSRSAFSLNQIGITTSPSRHLWHVCDESRATFSHGLATRGKVVMGVRSLADERTISSTVTASGHTRSGNPLVDGGGFYYAAVCHKALLRRQ